MSIEVKGLKELAANLDKQSKAIQQQFDEVLTEGAQSIEERAKLLAPVNDGRLKGSIFADTDIPLNKKVTASAFYAPYVEFGTKKKFEANGRADIAAKFKGMPKRGNFEQMVESLAEWIRKKGILTNGKAGRKTKDDRYKLAAYWMAKRILQNGIKPQPFFFRAYDEVWPTVLNKLKKIVK